MNFYKISILMIFSALGLSGCTSKKPSFTVGQCIMPVDGSQVWRLTQVSQEQWRGDLVSNSFVPVKDKAINQQRQYVVVPCHKDKK